MTLWDDAWEGHVETARFDIVTGLECRYHVAAMSAKYPTANGAGLAVCHR